MFILIKKSTLENMYQQIWQNDTITYTKDYDPCLYYKYCQTLLCLPTVCFTGCVH